jgi:site-specific DNA-methyltransferase (adenine-specific)
MKNKHKKKNGKKIFWTTEKRKVNDLIPYDQNPRSSDEVQDKGMDRSLDKNGYAELIAINKNNVIVAGHMRAEALKRLGRGEEYIEVRVPNRQLTEKEFRDYLLTSNRSGGSWDWSKLAANFDIGEMLTAGFDDADMTHIWDDLTVEDDTDFDEAKEIEKARKTNIKTGDMFRVGRHYVICSDSTDPNTVKKLVGKSKIDIINIDYPYNLGVSYNLGIGGKQNYGGTINDKKSDADYRKFVKDILENALSVSKPDCHVFTWLDEKYLGTFQEIFKEVGINFKRLVFWIKSNQNPTPQIAFNRAVELCMYSVKGKPFLSDKVKNLNEVLNKEIGTGNRLIDDILDMFQIWLAKRVASNLYEHPTMKPPSLYEKSLRRCSKPGDTVLDLCGGSGSLLVACECLKRQAFISEVEPVFVQLILNRFSKLNPNEKITKLN